MGEPINNDETAVGLVKIINTEPDNKSLVVAAAERIITTPIPDITKKGIILEGVDKRHFLSQSPYIYLGKNGETETKDGQINPETEKYSDPQNLAQVETSIYLTTLAVSDADEEDKTKFAQYAVTALRTWFIDKETMMIPSFEYAQMKPGEMVGNYWGIIDGAELIFITESVGILAEEKMIDQETYDGVRKWFGDYLKWLQEGEKGQMAKKMPNNHGTFYDLQVASIADFLGDRELVLETIGSAKERIESQIEPDGKMPLEAKRATPQDYEIFNLQAFTELALLAQKYDIDLWNWETADRRGIHQAINYFAEELKTAGSTPFKFDRKGAMHLVFQAASVVYNNPGFKALPAKYFPDPLVEEIVAKKLNKVNTGPNIITT